MKLKREDVTYGLELLVDIVGKERYLEITRMYGGMSLYIPTYKSALRNARNREIAIKYNGVNASRLASEYRMSVNHIKRILKSEGVM